MARQTPRRRGAARTGPSKCLGRRYNMEMIEDFLEHLLCELRLSLAPFDPEPETTDPELAVPVPRALGRYRCTLLPEVIVEYADPSGESEAAVWAKMVRGRRAQIAALELLLGGVFVDVRHSVAQSYDDTATEWPCCVLPAEKVLGDWDASGSLREIAIPSQPPAPGD